MLHERVSVHALRPMCVHPDGCESCQRKKHSQRLTVFASCLRTVEACKTCACIPCALCTRVAAIRACCRRSRASTMCARPSEFPTPPPLALPWCSTLVLPLPTDRTAAGSALSELATTAGAPGGPGGPGRPGRPCGPRRLNSDSRYASAARKWSTSWLNSSIAVSSVLRFSSKSARVVGTGEVSEQAKNKRERVWKQ